MSNNNNKHIKTYIDGIKTGVYAFVAITCSLMLIFRDTDMYLTFFYLFAVVVSIANIILTTIAVNKRDSSS